jgi:hypothetical protein
LRTGALGRYDKKVADCHFGLAQAYAVAPSKIEEGEGRVDVFVSDLLGRPSGGGGEGGDGAALPMTKETSRPRQSETNLRTSPTHGGFEEEDNVFGGAVTTTMGFGIPGPVNAFGSGGGNH